MILCTFWAIYMRCQYPRATTTYKYSAYDNLPKNQRIYNIKRTLKMAENQKIQANSFDGPVKRDLCRAGSNES